MVEEAGSEAGVMRFDADQAWRVATPIAFGSM